MSERMDDILSPEASRAREAVRALPRAEADPAFRARLRNDFVSGRRPGGARVRPAWPAFDPWKAARMAALPVAALLALALFAVANRGPALTLIGASSAGTVTVDGTAVPASDRDRLAGLIRPGVRVVLDDRASLDLLMDHVLVFEAAPGTEMIVPGSPGRWLFRTSRGRVERGEVRVMSGPDFPGRRLRMTTPDAVVELTGTVVSVYADTSGSCICVDEGTAMIGPSADRMQPVPAGMRMVVPRHEPAYVTTIAPPHQAHLKEFESEMAPRVGRSEAP